MSLVLVNLDRTPLRNVIYHTFSSPSGELFFGTMDNLLVSLSYNSPPTEISSVPTELGKKVSQQLSAFFHGELTTFDLTVGLSGTRFDQQVWTYVSEIPFGEKRSYKEIALKFEDANLARAVGSANGRNQVLIVIPCHRVVGANGDLTGYAGGLSAKKWLLSFEQNAISKQLSIF